MAYQKITLPLEGRRPPIVRILGRESWGGAATSGSNWQTLRLDLLNCQRAAIPGVGTALLRFRYGRFINGMIGIGSGSGQTFNPETNTITAPDLIGWEIRVQLAPDESQDAFRTVWWGQVDAQINEGMPGSEVPQGERIYRCVDGLQRTAKWMLDQHGIYRVADSSGRFSYGHPGYNAKSETGAVKGNRDSFNYMRNGVTLACHTWSGSGSTWTDADVMEHLAGCSRPIEEPLFNLTDDDALSGSNAWEVKPGDNVRALIDDVLDFRRGKGSYWVDWDDDLTDPDGPLTAKISTLPQHLGYVTFRSPVDPETEIQLDGATQAGSAIDVTLIGDHRIDDANFRIGDVTQHRVDFLETHGEAIQALVTGSYIDGGTLASPDDAALIGRRWSDADQTAIIAADEDARKAGKWRHVYTLHGINKNWTGLAGDGDNFDSVGKHSVDYQCADSGEIVHSQLSGSGTIVAPNVSGFSTKILSDVPLLEGYTYTGTTPERADADTSEETPSRRDVAIYIRNTDDRYDLAGSDEVDIKPNLSVSDYTMRISSSSDMEDGTRGFGNVDDFGSDYDITALVVTFAIELPFHARMGTGRQLPGAADPSQTFTKDTAKRRKIIEVDGAHLWIASPGAIWDLDYENGDSDGYPAKRGACMGSPSSIDSTGFGILRDDRDAIARIHALACEWYLKSRVEASWTLRDCGLMGSFSLAADEQFGGVGASVNYPTLGQFVQNLYANGLPNEINTPITSITYDHQEWSTTWTTGWGDLDTRNAR